MKYAVLGQEESGYRSIIQTLDIEQQFTSIEQLKGIIEDVDFEWEDIKPDLENVGFFNKRFNVATNQFEDMPEPLNSKLTKLQLIQRLTQSEQALLFFPDDVTGLPAEAKMGLKLFAKQIELAEFIDLDRPDIIGGLNQLESLGLMAHGRTLEIRGLDEDSIL